MDYGLTSEVSIVESLAHYSPAPFFRGGTFSIGLVSLVF
jgi:hypothetical protein